MATSFNGGSPVSSSSNPFSRGVGNQAGAGDDILPSLDVEGRERSVMMDLDDYGASAPVTSDAAAERPLNPPSIGGDVGNGA